MTNQAAQTMPETGSWFAADDVYRHARTIDVALNGEAGAASRPALCDVVSQIAALARQHGSLAAALAQTAGVAEPTLEMLNAGWRELERQGVDPESVEMRAVYDAMLAAAPAASGVDTSTNEAWAARAQEKIEAMDAAASVSERARGYRHSTHNVHRGPESLPCYCTATIDHLIGEEVSNGEALARRFHEAYERLAPSFGYETRTETRQFDPTTPNGRLMIAVCSEITLEQALTQQRGPTPKFAMGDAFGCSPVPPDEEAAIDAAAGFAKVILRLPVELLGEIDHRAQQDGCVRNAYLRELLARVHTTPQPSADAVRELSKREEYEWLDCPLKCSGGECKAKNAGCGSECPRPYRKLSAASGEKGVVAFRPCVCRTADEKRLCLNKRECVEVTPHSDHQQNAAQGWGEK